MFQLPSPPLPLSFSLLFTLFLLFFLLFLSPTHASSSSTSSPPNIVVLMADDLGFADVGYHGLRTDVKTPNIDKLANDGVIIRNFYSHPMCMPARGAFMTGRVPWSYGVTRESTHPLPSTPFLPELLRSHGYTSTMIGKWDLRARNAKSTLFNGFDESFHHTSSSSYVNTEIFQGRGPGFRLNDTYLTTACGDEAARYIRAHQGRGGGSAMPFFMWFAPLAPHIPWQAPEEYVNQFLSVQDPLRKMYLATLKALDDEIGKIMGALETTGQSENTLVVFLSDNGGLWEHAVHNDPYRGAKLMPTEGGLRVPALFYWPARLPRGGIYLPEFTIEDLHETLVEAAGMVHPDPNPTRRSHWADLLHAPLRQADFPGPLAHPIPYEMNRDLVQDINCYSAATRTGKYKLLIQNLDCVAAGEPRDPSPIRYTSFPTDHRHQVSLYDLAEDPLEQTDLLGLPDRKEAPEVQEALETLWRLYWSGVNDTKAAYGQRPIDKMISNLFCTSRMLQDTFHVTKTWKHIFTNIKTKVLFPANRTEGPADAFLLLVTGRSPVGHWKFHRDAFLIDSSRKRNHLVSKNRVYGALNPRLGAPDNWGFSSKTDWGLATGEKIELGGSSTFQAVFVLPDFAANRTLFCLSPTPDPSRSELRVLINEFGSIRIFLQAAMVFETQPGVCPGAVLLDVAIVLSQGQISAFVNGELVAAGSGSLQKPAYHLFLGVGKFDLLDEFVVYDCALSPEEIAEHQIPLGTVHPAWLHPPPTQPSILPEEPSILPEELYDDPSTDSSLGPSILPSIPFVEPSVEFPVLPSDLPEPSPTPPILKTPRRDPGREDEDFRQQKMASVPQPLLLIIVATSLGFTVIGLVKMTRILNWNSIHRRSVF